ncbi:MAG TPA: sugar ABC transporter ATP-binding protein [Baekduia sp.]|nr:sugar ABC transporter ATP-binding protein [Baekduia sp.]
MTGALELRGVSKTFPGVRALVGVDLHVRSGSVHALLGHNGCGKSTLVKTLAGFHAPDGAAEAFVDGEPLQLGSAEDAERCGVRFVHQELGLIHELPAVDNVAFVVGHGTTRLRPINWRAQARRTRELLMEFGIDLDPRAPIGDATPVERTAVAIVRAVAGWERGRGVLVLDEPTAALPAREVEQLFKLIREIRDSGTAVLLVSHRLDEVMSICDHATVMRAGEVIWDGAVGETSLRDLATLIAGTDALPEEVAHAAAHVDTGDRDTPLLRVDGLSGRYLRDVSFTVREGEILGVAGLLGSGREELPYALAGAPKHPVQGAVAVDGDPIEPLTVGAAHAHGVVLVPADRAREGIVAGFSVRENVTLAALPALASKATIAPRRERRFARDWLHAVGAEVAVAERPITTLSGGNQQKAVLARWLAVAPKVLCVSEPTAGIDVGARATIYADLRRRAADGLAIVMSSSDAEDLVSACDRVLVLRDGVVVRELAGQAISKQAIVAAMEGAHDDHQD